ncbi:hypothetical protein [Streptomyces sp. YPW6]|uniref:hypothetical protein n=1 Tax=Streptomyces sp. YPW6 TaxID=2840373 RepID=UPI003D75BEBF
MSDRFGSVTMKLDESGAAWEVACSRCPWGTEELLETGFDGYLGVENYSLVESLAQDHSDRHS